MIKTSNDHGVICSDVLANDSTKQQNSYVTYLLDILHIKMKTCFVSNVKKNSERQQQTLTVQSETTTACLKCIIYLLQQQGRTIRGSKYAEVYNKKKKKKHKYIQQFKQALNFSVQLDECTDMMALETIFDGYSY
jgi:hypothetical protein